ncbi:MAG: ATP-dependent sacrificial sulfur transferase LarE [Armatimonadetes bacterium]|nr:ATP-dependent sacrificial sulfur transferase LarE [Armatimonadota bacterium]
MSSLLKDKLENLKTILRDTGGCAVAYSGGVDSTLLLTVAREMLGEKCLAVIATSSTYPKREFEAAISWLTDQGIPHVVIESEELDIAGFAENPPDRCYFCKKELFGKIRREAQIRGLDFVADGSNADDVNDFRPGTLAAQELGIISPLKQAGLTKDEIRLISREVYSLPVADKPSMACMSSRFPYGSKITRDKLKQVEDVEDFLFARGFRTLRARHHGDLLRLELGPEEMGMMENPEVCTACVDFAKKHGFNYVTLDLEGFRSGSMNEPLRRAGLDTK